MKSLRRLVIAAAVAAGILLLLHPQYEKYMDHYYARTCSKARHYTMDMYSDELRDRKAGTDGPSEADMRLFLQNFVKNTYDQEVTEELTCTSMCRGGGTVTFHIDPAEFTMYAVCSLHGK